MSKKTKVSLVNVTADNTAEAIALNNKEFELSVPTEEVKVSADTTPEVISETIDIKSTEITPAPAEEVKEEKPEPTVEEMVKAQEKEINEKIDDNFYGEVEHPTPSVKEIKEKLDDKWYIKLNDNPLSDEKRRVYESRVEKCNLNYIFDATGIMLVGPFNTEREAVMARKRLVGKGLKGVVEYDHFFK